MKTQLTKTSHYVIKVSWGETGIWNPTVGQPKRDSSLKQARDFAMKSIYDDLKERYPNADFALRLDKVTTTVEEETIHTIST